MLLSSGPKLTSDGLKLSGTLFCGQINQNLKWDNLDNMDAAAARLKKRATNWNGICTQFKSLHVWLYRVTLALMKLTCRCGRATQVLKS